MLCEAIRASWNCVLAKRIWDSAGGDDAPDRVEVVRCFSMMAFFFSDVLSQPGENILGIAGYGEYEPW